MKTLLLFLSLIVATSQAATVRLYFTDPLTNDKDTNAFYITPIGTNVLSSGGVVGRGVTTRYVPASNGYRTNTLAVGHYSITNRSLGSGVVIRVPDSSSLYDYTNILISGYNIFVTITNGDSGTSGALTNNDTRAVTFDTSLTIGAGSAANSIHPSAGLLTFSNSILANGSYIKGRSIIGTNFVGNGASLTNLHGSNSITAGTIDTNKMDATAYAAFVGGGDVTQSGLAAGSYISSETNGARLGDKIKLLTGNYKPVDLIVDFDFASDADEEHGLKQTFTMADRGFFKLRAIGNTFTNPVSAAYIAKYANYYGYGDVPIGVTRTQRYLPYLNWTNNAAQGFVSPYHLVTNTIFKSHSFWNTNYADVVSVYRKALVESANSNVVLAVEGELSNLRQLWESPADAYSSLNGSNLCELKIKYIIISAGMTNNLNNYEYNLVVDPFASEVVNLLTVPVVWSFANVVTNPGLGDISVGQNTYDPTIHPVDSPIYQGMTNYNAHFGASAAIRPAWIGVVRTYMAAARNIADGTNWIDGENYFNLVGPGRVDYQGNGFTAWSNTIAGKNANQYYIVTTQTFRDASTNLINEMIDAPPLNGAYRNRRVKQFTGVSIPIDSIDYGSSLLTSASGMTYSRLDYGGVVGGLVNSSGFIYTSAGSTDFSIAFNLPSTVTQAVASVTMFAGTNDSYTFSGYYNPYYETNDFVVGSTSTQAITNKMGDFYTVTWTNSWTGNAANRPKKMRGYWGANYTTSAAGLRYIMAVEANVKHSTEQ